MFRPLAFTKTFAMASASLLSITLVPVLMTLFIRGPEAAGPRRRTRSRGLQRGDLRAGPPAARSGGSGRRCSSTSPSCPLTVPLLFVIGSEFMPPLYEGSLLYMPTSPPGLSVTEATRLLQMQDRVLRRFPEVERVFGTVGRGTTRDRQLADGHGEHHGDAEAARAVAARA